MAWVDLFKGASGKSFAIGVAAGSLAPVVVPIIVSVAKPLARAALRTGIVVYEKGRETFAEINELVDDVVAEVRADLEAKALGADGEDEDHLQTELEETERPKDEVSQRRL